MNIPFRITPGLLKVIVPHFSFNSTTVSISFCSRLIAGEARPPLKSGISKPSNPCCSPWSLNTNKIILQHHPRGIILRVAKFSSDCSPNDTRKESIVRQNFHKECECGINRQINMELVASYVYLSMAYYFDRDDIAMPGFHIYFKNASYEETEHAHKLMVYLNKRGGRLKLSNINAPETNDWEGAEYAMMTALDLEKDVNEALLTLHKIAGKHNDANLSDFIETEFLQHQVESIREIAEQLTKIRRVGEGLGIFIYDKELYKSLSSSKSH